ncbi:MAG: hypothetical protein LBH25_09860 [Fibromonadaceae bacterium]|jgi:hypothetical protein|nr:hypothetical protein [Fibromonadaceae bacterium]
MKKVIFTAVFALFATQAFAIFGVGAHYAMNTGSLKSSKEPVYTLNVDTEVGSKSASVDFEQKSADVLQGLGVKAWIDVIPFIDIEGTFNITATRYKVSLDLPYLEGTEIARKSIDLSYTPDAPLNLAFGDVDPFYALFSGDLSVTYPFTSLPVPFVRPYVGIGLSYIFSLPVINASFTKKMIDKDLVEKLAGSEGDQTKIADDIVDKLVDALKDENYKGGFGGHVIAGFRIKPPVIPFAIYANTKYYFGGETGPFKQGVVLEAGGGFAL